MPLDSVWNPTPKNAAEAYEEWSAWYSGDPNQIAAVYSGILTGLSNPRGRMWGKEVVDEKKTQLHVPIAGDIAAKSAQLLFAEAPSIKVDDEATQARLEEIIEEGGLHARLLEAAEVAAALGGVYLKPAWDKAVSGVPFLTIAQADTAVPSFVHGMLREVYFWRVVESEGRKVVRHVERYSVANGVGVVEHELWEGTHEKLGRMVDLSGHAETAGLVPWYASKYPGLLACYVPNMRPNRKWRGSALGQSDFSGLEGLMDALDEAYTSWLRDLRLGKARLIIPEMFLKRGRNGQPVFDEDREIYTVLDVDPKNLANSGVMPSQANIRADDHLKTCLELITRIVSGAGYSPSTFGLMGEAAPTATEVRSRERASFVTRGKKERYWRPALAHMTHVLLAIDNEVFSGGNNLEDRPKVQLADSVQPDLSEIAASVGMLVTAQAISIKRRVEMVNPDWDENQIDEEVKLIQGEQGALLADPTIGKEDEEVGDLA